MELDEDADLVKPLFFVMVSSILLVIPENILFLLLELILLLFFVLIFSKLFVTPENIRFLNDELTPVLSFIIEERFES